MNIIKLILLIWSQLKSLLVAFGFYLGELIFVLDLNASCRNEYLQDFQLNNFAIKLTQNTL